jgi:hypothetical protein
VGSEGVASLIGHDPELEREANTLPNDLNDVKEALRIEADRLRRQGNADDHPTSRQEIS